MEKCNKCGNEWAPIECPEYEGAKEKICKSCGEEMEWEDCEECEGTGYVIFHEEVCDCSRIPFYIGHDNRHGLWKCFSPGCLQAEKMTTYQESKIKKEKLKIEEEKTRILYDYDLMEIEEEKARDFTRSVFLGEISKEIIILEEIEKEKAVHRELLENAIEDYFEKVKQGKSLNEEQRKALNYLYWNTELQTTKLTNLTKLEGFDFTNAIDPKELFLPCLVTGCPKEISINVRTRRQRNATFNLYDSILDIGNFDLLTSNEFQQFVYEGCLPKILPKERSTQNQKPMTRKEEIIQNALKAEIERLRSLPYDEYLQSEHWQNTRRKALKYYGYKCRVCNTNSKELHVHHKTYVRLRCERMSDLMVLCKDHHSTIHIPAKE